MNLWIDDLRPAPSGCHWAKSVNQAKAMIVQAEDQGQPYDRIDLDHDAGDFAWDGGDYIRVLDWLEETNRSYPIALHTMNPVGRQNMLAIVEKNHWPFLFP